MNTYQHYQQARDVAWQVLLKLGISALPVDAKGAARQMGVEVLPFPNREEEPRLHALLSRLGHAPCRSLRLQGRWHIFLKQGALDDQHAHFAVAHELGHILLKHETEALAPGVRAFRSRENAGDVLPDPLDLSDYAADIFAVRLLAPACILHVQGARTVAQIQRLCGLPPEAARLRQERMQLLRQRNAFLSHPLERQVLAQFYPGLGGQGIPAEDQSAHLSPARQLILASGPKVDGDWPAPPPEEGDTEKMNTENIPPGSAREDAKKPVKQDMAEEMPEIPAVALQRSEAEMYPAAEASAEVENAALRNARAKNGKKARRRAIIILAVLLSSLILAALFILCFPGQPALPPPASPAG